MAWRPGARVRNGALFQAGSAALSTGTATVAYVRTVAGADEWLQADLVTWGARVEFAAPYAAGEGFIHELSAVPAATDPPYSITFYVTHSVYGTVYSETHLVEEGGGSGAGLDVRLNP